MTRTKRNHLGTMFITAMTSILLVGCASGGASNSAGENGGTDPDTVGVVNDQPDGGDPVNGGTLRFASYSAVAGLDPTTTHPTGTTGGTELAAVYDVLMRYDASDGTYHPQLAKSLTESDDHLSWTLKLRDGITFSDGTPLDAAAVVASTERYNLLHGLDSEVFQASVKSVEATDNSTVVYTLNQPWTDFRGILTLGHGIIVGSGSDAGEQFTPIGAGAFTFESLTQEKLVLKAKPDYWNGKPHLDTLEFVNITDESPKIETLNSGGIQMAFLREAKAVNSAMAQFPGYVETFSMTDLVQINSRPGRPGSDVRVRQAIQLAIDPDTLNERANGGEGMPGSKMFQSWSKWDNDVPNIAVDLEQAQALVADAMADGFDGKLTYVSAQGQSSQQFALAVQAMLKNIGLDITIDFTSSVTDLTRLIYVEHDFDLGYGALSISDAAPFPRLYSSLNGTSSNNVGGYEDPEIDSLLSKVQSATTDETKRDALADLQVEINEKVPLITLGAGPNFVPWTENVHGVVPTMDSIMLLDQAWIG